MPSPFSRLCHNHFTPDDYRIPDIPVHGSERKVLKKEAIPSLFLSRFESPSRNKEAEFHRRERAKRRKLREENKPDSAPLATQDTLDADFEIENEKAPVTDWIGLEEIVEEETELNCPGPREEKDKKTLKEFKLPWK